MKKRLIVTNINGRIVIEIKGESIFPYDPLLLKELLDIASRKLKQGELKSQEENKYEQSLYCDERWQ